MTNSKFGKTLSAGACLALFAVTGALAGDADEKEKLASCAKEICGILVSKDAAGPDLTCDLTKTWEKDEIQKEADQKKLAWGLGSAKCSVKVSAKRSELISALTSPQNTLKAGKQSVACEIGTEKYPVSITVAPEMKFKDGAATNVSLHVDDVQGATLIKGVVWSAAELEKHFGILEGDMVREVNKFVQKECPKIVNGAKWREPPRWVGESPLSKLL